MSADRAGAVSSNGFRVPTLVMVSLTIAGVVLLLCGLSGTIDLGEDGDVVRAFVSRQFDHICNGLDDLCRGGGSVYAPSSESRTFEILAQAVAAGFARIVSSGVYVLKACLNTFTVLGLIAFALAGLLDLYNSQYPRHTP